MCRAQIRAVKALGFTARLSRIDRTIRECSAVIKVVQDAEFARRDRTPLSFARSTLFSDRLARGKKMMNSSRSNPLLSNQRVILLPIRSPLLQRRRLLTAIVVGAFLFIANLAVPLGRSNDRAERAVAIFLALAGLLYFWLKPRRGGTLVFAPKCIHYSVAFVGDIKYEAVRNVEITTRFGDRVLAIEVEAVLPNGGSRTAPVFVNETQLEPGVSILDVQELLEMGREGRLQSLPEMSAPATTLAPVARPNALDLALGIIILVGAVVVQCTFGVMFSPDDGFETLEEGPRFLVVIPLVALWWGLLFGSRRMRRFFTTGSGGVLAIMLAAYGAIVFWHLVDMANKNWDHSAGEDVIYVVDGKFTYGSRGNYSGFTGHPLAHPEQDSDEFKHLGASYLQDAEIGDQFCVHRHPGFLGARWITGCAKSDVR